MAEKLFFGNTNSPFGGHTANYHAANGFTSSFSGRVSRLVIEATASGSVKPQIYSGSTWLSASLLWADDVGVAVTVGNNDIAVNIPIVAAGNYWISAVGSVLGAFGYSTGTSSYRFKASSYGPFIAPDPPGSGYSNATTELPFRAYGWEPPTISSIDDSFISSGKTRTLTGTDFMTTSDPISKIEICNNSVYASATVKTPQTNIANQTDTGVDFDCVTTGLSGPAWIFLTTGLGQINATGLAVDVGIQAYAWIQRSDGSLSAYPHAVIIL